MRPSWVEVDLGAIRHNVRAVAAAVRPAAVCAVVKADGYGHGDVPVAEAALEAGATRLAVALVSEGIGLREAGIEAPILLLSEPAAGDVGDVVRWRLTPTVYRQSLLGALTEAAPSGFPVHVKVDTGMHRVGATADVAHLLAAEIFSGPLLLEGVWTHFPVAEADHAFTRGQVTALAAFVEELARSGVRPQMIHAANTAGALADLGACFDMVRIGLGVYGLRPATGYALEVDLRPAMSVVSRVTYLRRHPAGTRPSYGRVRGLERDSTVATVPIGYADGIPRRLVDAGGVVLIGGKRRQFAGSVTMDQVLVDVGDDPVAVGDEVVLLGRQGDEEISADEWAARLGTIVWEIVCGFGPRLPRRFTE